jgi:SAM-dependent methyltransferase
MESVVRIDIDSVIRSGERVVVDIGCGERKKAGRIGIDSADLPGVDIVADLEKGLSYFPDGSVDEIHCRSVLEHIRDLEGILREMLRVLKKGGMVHVFVPHFSNPYYYSDYTHVRFFGLYTFYYFVETEGQLKRKVPNHYSDLRIRIVSQKLVFRSAFAWMNPCRKLFGWAVNRHSRLQEFYEGHWSSVVPCHGMEIVFTRAG